MSIKQKISPNLGLIVEAIGIVFHHVKATILPFLWQIRFQILQFLVRKQAKAASFATQFNNTIGLPANLELALLSSVLTPINNRLIAICPPSVLRIFEHSKAAFPNLLVATQQFSKKQSLVMMIVIVVCSMAHIRKSESTPSVKEASTANITLEFKAAGVLEESFRKSLADNGITPNLIKMLESALKSKIDIDKCGKGDAIKFVWEEKQYAGQSYKLQQLKSVYFNSKNTHTKVYLFRYNNEITEGWYEQNGLPKQGGIDSPVINGKITSRFSRHRKHPVLGFRRPHFGTDYAAPKGSPIYAIADGIVVEARYKSGNGRYVKIKHNDIYETEYLHMSHYGDGIEQGTNVKRRQIIGYIGMSGLTTGPHVCFRFLKNGKAVDHLKAEIFTDEDHEKFNKIVADQREKLDKINE